MITVHIRSEEERSLKRSHGMASGLCIPEKQSAEQDGYSCLEGIDEYSIDPGIVFDSHSHREVEILTYIVNGILDYRDDAGHRQLLLGGEVQVVGAGAGITHSESNASHAEPLHVIQAWIRPDKDRKRQTHYEQKYFPDDAKRNKLCLIASGDSRLGSLSISQDTDVYAGVLRDVDPVLFQRAQKRSAWIQVARGALMVNNVALGSGDAAAIQGNDDNNLRLQANVETEFLLFDLP
ncbi:MAG: pirin family protein [Gammaproteobacteria bacterium]|nr:pirin family protein [Gammaproteobacteria bacterium]MDH3767573.1 pirin family protein [Gammaproteobacteria bacterium]